MYYYFLLSGDANPAAPDIAAVATVNAELEFSLGYIMAIKAITNPVSARNSGMEAFIFSCIMDTKLLVRNAREWVGTPCLHGQSAKGFGADCVGFLYAVAKESGYTLPPFENHHYYPINNELFIYLNKHFLPTANDISEGNIYLFKFRGINAHVGISTDIGVVHACPFAKKIVEHCIDDIWKKRIKGRYLWQ